MEPELIYDTLLQYDLMLFPTFYPGEGLPGTIIDSYISRLPILASDWKYNGELIVDGESGILHQAEDVNDLFDKIKLLALDSKLLNQLSSGIEKIRYRFSESYAWDILVRHGLV